MSYTRRISDSTKKLLYVKSGNQCTICKATLIYDNTSNISEICHIEAINEDGARFNPNLTDEYINSYDNLILLCPRCHAIVDNKLNKANYSVDFLKQLKYNHENMVNDMNNNQFVFDPTFFISNIHVSDKVVDALRKYTSEDIQNCLKSIVYAKPITRTMMYAIVCMCHWSRRSRIDTLMLRERINVEDYDFAQTLMILEQMGFIAETYYNGEMDGFENENGDFHLVKDDYWFKASKGEWYLSKYGQILLEIRAFLDSPDRFFELLCCKRIELLE